MVHDFLRNLILAKLRENKVQHLIGNHVELTYGTELKLFNLLMLGQGEGSCLTVTKQNINREAVKLPGRYNQQAGNQTAGIFFGSIYLLISHNSSQGSHSYQPEEFLSPPVLNDSPVIIQALCRQPFTWYKTAMLESERCTGTSQTKEITI